MALSVDGGRPQASVPGDVSVISLKCTCNKSAAAGAAHIALSSWRRSAGIKWPRRLPEREITLQRNHRPAYRNAARSIIVSARCLSAERNFIIANCNVKSALYRADNGGVNEAPAH